MRFECAPVLLVLVGRSGFDESEVGSAIAFSNAARTECSVEPA